MFREEALSRMMKYCAYQERSHAQVRNKLLKLKVYGDALESIISELITEGFLNEERYARTYVRGKFRNNKWGRNKILMGLKHNKISSYCIKKGMEEIEEEEYRLVLQSVLLKKLTHSSKDDKYVNFKKVTQYALQRGFEYDLVKEVLNELIEEQKTD
jgi:regulatory protein